MQFSMTLKRKNDIYKELIKFFNQVKTYIEQELKYFQRDNVGEY